MALKRDRAGQPTAILEINHDITARKRVEEALHQSDERLKLAVKAARMVAWTWNASTNIITRSETACEILGLTEYYLILQSANKPKSPANNQKRKKNNCCSENELPEQKQKPQMVSRMSF